MLDELEKLLAFALSRKSTDIHFEKDLKHNNLRISVRTIDGFIDYAGSLLNMQLMEYLKYIANLDLININQPQSGSFSYIYNQEEYYFRLASVKTIYKEICVLRILNQFYISKDIFNPIMADIKELLEVKSGLIIFSGLTGSGKTTSMYSLMHMFKDKKIYSIEDPTEIYFANIIQMDINKKRNFGYSEAITQVLRHDPDLICIGEIRDEEAAKMAIRAAYTGHLVISTIHARSSLQTIARLLDLGVSQAELDDNLIFVANQTLKVKDKERYSSYEVITFKN
ncbi:MAG: Flp pilus assembly complex ATPase component TadA [Erysipelothrix sp.]|nr:Flp pilus assembly complex ATPase component TadA [Erysipelothrix sp.]